MQAIYHGQNCIWPGNGVRTAAWLAYGEIMEFRLPRIESQETHMKTFSGAALHW